MEDDIVVLKCENCGEDFLYQTHKGRGSKNMARYCDSCKALKARESRDAYRKKLKEKNEANSKATNRELEEFAMNAIKFPLIEESPKEDVIVDKYTEFIEKISNSLMALDTIRVELCDVAKQMNEYQSNYDKADQAYLHKLEVMDMSSPEKAVAFVKEWKSSRSSRRNVKDLIQIVSDTIDAIPYKNYANAIPVLKGFRGVK